MTTLTLGKARLNLDDFAIQGNALVGIKESGKTYTATYLAEQLMLSGVPIVAFDPIDVWRYLRVPGRGQGFPVVVAGEGGDLPLTPESAPQIMRAAMQAGVSLVLNLYSRTLSKANWRQIVTECVAVLLYENKDYGPRHIFLEEAPEFVPQRVRPNQGVVYDMIERLGRMGGNAYLGYTLIGQRAEEINKALLEICDGLFLHRQKGRNSLQALGRWLEAAGVEKPKPIMASIPLLEAGECWVWPKASQVPVRTRVPAKQSLHPDRRTHHKLTTRAQPIDVGQFVAQMQAVLEGKQQPKVEWHKSPLPSVDAPLAQAWNENPPLIQEEDDDMGEIEQKLLREILDKLDGPRPSASRSDRAPDNGTTVMTLDPSLEEVYAYVLERLKREAPALLVQLTQSVPQIELAVRRVTVELDDSSLRGKLVKLAAEGFFDQGASASAAITELGRRGQSVFKGAVYDEMNELAGLGLFTVDKRGKEAKLYTRVPDVKITKKGA